MIPRPAYLAEVAAALAANPVCALLGPRQCGKTTLAREVASRHGRRTHVFDLEVAADRARLAEPELALGPLEGLVVIDEIQRRPDLFTTLRPLVDRPRARSRFLLLGSASPELVRGVAESLAGRVGFVDLSGFDLHEVGPEEGRRLWLRGGYPRSFLARDDPRSLAWRDDLIRTILERDVPQLGIRVPAETLHRFWTMLAHYHAQIWNGAELAGSLGVTEHSVRRYLDVLVGLYLVRRLQPWHENLAKRQFKSPKVYVRDSGLLHALLSVASGPELDGHPKCGASWEGFAMEQVLRAAGARDCFFWGTHAGAELDLLLLRRGKRYGVEFKRSDAPTMTRSLHVALSDLKLDRAWIVYPGSRVYRVHERVEVVPLDAAAERLAPISARRGPPQTMRRARRVDSESRSGGRRSSASD
ncbi:MAG: ATP-binding protein [Planctomycetes bacterium]|nr:ATP-binding protein [Planctomycetota bacterium]